MQNCRIRTYVSALFELSHLHGKDTTEPKEKNLSNILLIALHRSSESGNKFQIQKPSLWSQYVIKFGNNKGQSSLQNFEGMHFFKIWERSLFGKVGDSLYSNWEILFEFHFEFLDISWYFRSFYFRTVYFWKVYLCSMYFRSLNSRSLYFRSLNFRSLYWW